jgi:PAS domain S-box-containing protein
MIADLLSQQPSDPTSLPANEPERLAALHRYQILDTPAEVAFDRITTLAARLFKIPTVLISLVDESRAWFKSSIGFDAPEVSRDMTICRFAVLTDEPLIVPDIRLDERFACNPFVQCEPGLRFYAGAPLIDRDGYNLGTLCLLDSVPRAPLTAEQQAILVDLAAMVVDEMELRLAAQQMARVDTALVEITQGVARVTGGDFFNELVRHFAKVLGTDYVYIGVVEGHEPKMIRMIATCDRGKIVENFEYRLADTPCWEAIEQGEICCYSRNVQALFPKAPLLKPLAVESYIATPFYSADGRVLGVLGVMDGKPLINVHLAESLLTIFASRIATELERQQYELLLVEQTQLLEAVSTGQSLDECLSGLCRSIAKLSPGTRACVLLTDDCRLKFPRSITPDFPPSLSLGLKDAPINEQKIGTCGTAVYCGEPVGCTDIATDKGWSAGWRALCIAHGIQACYSAPIIGIDNLPLGSLMLCFNEARLPTDWEYHLGKFGTKIASITTERRQAEANLRQSQALAQRQLSEIEAIYQTAPIGLAILNLDLRYERINHGLAEINGIAVEDHIGRTLREIVPALADENEPLLRSVFATGKPLLNIEISGETQALPGVERTWIENCYPLKDATGQIVGINVVVQEITARKRAEAALAERNKELDSFVHTISHDLKAPLRAISNLSQWIEDDLEDRLSPDN